MVSNQLSLWTNTVKTWYNGAMDIRLFDGSEARQIDPDGIEWPDGSDVIYAIEDNKIVGRLGRIFLPCLEGGWVAENKRGGRLALKLAANMERIIKASGKSHSFAHVYEKQPEVAELLEHLGYKEMPLKIYMKEL